jgi:hypothetical protein
LELLLSDVQLRKGGVLAHLAWKPQVFGEIPSFYADVPGELTDGHISFWLGRFPG